MKLIETLGGNRRNILTKVVFPANIPNLFSIMKVDIGLCLVGVVIGEFISSRRGLGYMIIETGLGHSWNRDTLSDRHGIVSVDCIFREMVSEKGITVVIISRYIGNTKTLYPDHSVDTAFHFLLLFFKCFTVFYC